MSRIFLTAACGLYLAGAGLALAQTNSSMNNSMSGTNDTAMSHDNSKGSNAQGGMSHDDMKSGSSHDSMKSSSGSSSQH